MPRYFFSLSDGHDSIEDEVGLELSGEAELRAETVAALSELLDQESKIRQLAQGWKLAVSDEADAVLFTIPLV
jgi:hypothetical protein